MPRTPFFLAASLLLAALCPAAPAQTFTALAALPFDNSGPVLREPIQAQRPFTVAGEQGVLLGQQDGSFESWVLPVKLLSHLTIQADIAGYPVPIDVNRLAAHIEVRPDRTVITYSHIGFTVRQIMFSTDGPASSTGTLTGPVVLFQFQCLHPTVFTLSFTPELRWMWPERNEGTPSPEWVNAPGGGFYVLHTDYPSFAGAVTIPGAQPGILAPYQERPQEHPVQLILPIDPARDNGRLFPLLMAVGVNTAAANTHSLGLALSALNASLAALYQAHAEAYQNLLDHSTSISTPDHDLNQAFQWAVVSIEQLRARAQPSGNTALVAGYYVSGDSARPGFGWFFGRDALYSLYAVNSYGDFALSRSELEFLILNQRDDGKIMHEYSQTAAAIDWKAFPYMYAAADATPLFLLAVDDYVHSTGDVAFLRQHRDAVEKAWSFETTHDTDGDGIYDNSQGTGWVESWPGGMPHQEIYLALLDQQASAAMARMQQLLGSAQQSAAAQQRAQAIAKTINAEYYDPQKACYAFSHNPDGSQDRTATVFPALAWWSDPTGSSILNHPGACLRQFAAHSLATDWGLRDLSSDEKIYDGMSYHQGSVWPLFTGWAALAEYRANQPLAGYQLLMENAHLTRAQDLGADTELLSGDFYVPFGRSTSHQLWSSAMVITPTLRGLFGISIDALTRTITVNPHLPASWDSASVSDLPLPSGPASLSFTRRGDQLEVALNGTGTEDWHLKSDEPGATTGPLNVELFKELRIPPALGLRIPLPALEVDGSASPLPTDAVKDAALLNKPPQPGSSTARPRILHQETTAHKLTLTAEGLAGSDAILTVYRHGHFLPKVETDPPSDPAGAQPTASLSYRDCDADLYACKWMPLVIHFPPGQGWQTVTVSLSW